MLVVWRLQKRTNMGIIDRNQLIRIIHGAKDSRNKDHPNNKIFIDESYAKRLAGEIIGFLKNADDNGIDNRLSKQLKERNEILVKLVNGIYGNPIKLHNKSKKEIWDKIIRMDKNKKLIINTR